VAVVGAASSILHQVTEELDIAYSQFLVEDRRSPSQSSLSP
jgi:hypothetical protein